MNRKLFRRHLAAIAALLAAFALLPAEAAPKNRARPSAGRTVTIPECGVRLRMVPDTELRMLPPLQVRATLKSDGTPLYRVQDLWIHSQLLAIWTGEEVTAMLAAVKFPPVAKPDSLARNGDVSTWRTYPRIPDDDELRRWVARFSGERVTEIVKLSGYGDFSWRRLRSENRASYLYFGSGRNNGVDQMFLLFLRWRGTPGTRERDRARLADACAFSLRMVPRASPASPGGGIPVRPAATNASVYAERLAQAQKSIAGMRGWYIRETPNYIFVSNQKSRNDIRRLQSDLEAAREIFRSYFPPEEERACVGVVKLFGRREEYLRYVGSELQWTGGLWNSGTRELLVSPIDPRFDEKTIEKHMREVTLHEGFHQYIFYAAREIGPALWFNEGCAQFFERSAPRRGEVGSLDKATESRLAAAANAADDDLERFLLLDHAGFYAEKDREQNYALAYALMYYLLRGAPANGDGAFAALPGRYLAALRQTRDLRRAHSIALAGIDTRALAARLKGFWRDRNQLRKARQKQWAPGRSAFPR